MQVKLVNNEGQELDLPFTLSWTDTDTTKEVPTIERATGDGAARAGKERVASREFTISGPIYKYPRHDIKDKLDEIIEFMRFTPIRVYQQDYDERFIYAFPQGDSRSWTDNRKELDLDIPFIAPDPYFYSEDELGVDDEYVVSYTYELGAAMEPEPRFIQPFMPAEEETYYEVDVWIPDTLHLDIDNPGSYEAYPEITLIAKSFGGNNTVLNPVIENKTTGSIIEFQQEILSGESVVIDSDNVEVSFQGQNVLNQVNDDFLLYKFFFEAGNNELEISWDADVDASARIELQIKYRARWL